MIIEKHYSHKHNKSQMFFDNDSLTGCENTFDIVGVHCCGEVSEQLLVLIGSELADVLQLHKKGG